MASDPLEDKALKPTQPGFAPATESFPSITPSTTSTADEKNHPVNIELQRVSSVSPPATVHHGTPYETDIEAMTTQHSSDRLNRRSTANVHDPNCTVWPGQDHWKQKARAAKINNRSCQPFARLDRRTRIAIKITIIILVVAIAIGVGFGVSKPLGASIWKPNS